MKMRSYLLSLLLVLVLFDCRAQSIATGSIANAAFCGAAAFAVPYTATGTFNAGNIFTAQLSDSLGSFGSPVSIGTLASLTSGSIAVTIPPDTTTGSAYRIRVVSSNPALTGTDNGANLTVYPLPVPYYTIANLMDTLATCPPINISAFYDLSRGNIVSYLWNFHDGNPPISGLYPSQVYPFPGVFPVTETVTTNYGCVDSVTLFDINVGGPTVVSVTPSVSTGCPCTNVSFYISTYDADSISLTSDNGQPLFYLNIPISPRGTAAHPTLDTITIEYCYTGTHIPSIVVVDGNYCHSQFNNFATITIDSPSVAFSYTLHGCDSVCFTDQTTYTATAAHTVSRLWNFGDGTPLDTSANPCHDYQTIGQFNVTLTVTANTGCSSSTSQPLPIRGPIPPIVSISASQLSLCSGSADTFTATPTNGGTAPTYQWYKNNLPVGGTDSVYITSSLNNNDSIWVVMTSNVARASPLTGMSNKIRVSVTPTVSPMVTITATDTVFPYGVPAADTFTATSVNGGPSPIYQWFNDGMAIATGSIYIADSLNNNDSIWVVMTSNATCAYPSSLPGNIITVTVLPAPGDSVWPGDADNNRMVDNNDLLAIGLAYYYSGALRPNASIVWQAQTCIPWADTFAGGSNFNHADCNGDGTVNADDTLAVTQNFGLIHLKTNPSGAPWRSGIPALSAVLNKDTLYDGDTVTVTFMLGDASAMVNNIYGLAFTYNFDPLIMDSTSAYTTFGDSWFGTSIDKISLSKIFAGQGQIKTGLTRIDQNTRSGSGAIGTAGFVISTAQLTGHSTSYYTNTGFISDVKAIDNAGIPIQLNTGADTGVVVYYPNGITEINGAHVRLMPNPARDHVTISADIALYEVLITNVTGQEIAHNAKIQNRSADIDIRDLNAGLYFVQVRSASDMTILKLTVER